MHKDSGEIRAKDLKTVRGNYNRLVTGIRQIIIYRGRDLPHMTEKDEPVSMYTDADLGKDLIASEKNELIYINAMLELMKTVHSELTKKKMNKAVLQDLYMKMMKLTVAESREDLISKRIWKTPTSPTRSSPCWVRPAAMRP